MKEFIIFICLIIAFQFSKEQNCNDSNLLHFLVESKESISYEMQDDILKKNDLSFLWINYQRFRLGFIGEHYQRFYIHFTKIEKNTINHSIYLINGITKVKNNLCDFKGEIKIDSIYEINKKENAWWSNEYKKYNDSEAMKHYQYKRFLLLCEYSFNENSNQQNSGSFKGILRTFIYLRNDSIFYDGLDYGSDRWANNLFVGIWKDYKSGIEKICNWGDGRILDSGDLDIGAAEFYPNKKYLRNGWENHNKALYGGKNARKEEQEEWWKK